jgi:hypothetical protein
MSSSSSSLSLASLFASLPNLENLKLHKLTEQVRGRGIIRDPLDSQEQVCLRKLKSLKLHSTEYSREFLSDLFSLCPNLGSLSIEDEPNYIRDSVQEEAVLQCLFCSSYNFINTLHLCLVNEEIMGFLVRKLRASVLKCFTVKRLDRVESDTFEQFLHAQKISLELFRIELGRCNGLRVIFPTMPALKTLSLRFVHSYSENPPSFGTFDYGTQFPSLCTLEIDDKSLYTLKKRAYIWVEVFPHHQYQISSPSLSLRNLRLPENIENAEQLQGITQLFPKVKKLKIAAQRDLDVLRVIWDSPWSSSLEVLQLSFYTSSSPIPSNVNCKIDSIVTGIPEMRCEEMMVSFKRESLEFQNILNISHSIRDLKSKETSYLQF